MRKQVIFLAGALAMAPLGARGADLVVWWEKGYYAEEDEAVREIIAAFERETRKEVELVQYGYPEIYDKVEAVAKIGQPPDFLFSTFSAAMIPQWAYENPLADLQGVLGPLLDLFDADLVQASMLLNGTTHRRGLYALPMGQSSNHVHVWSNFLERAGFTLADIPDEWDWFWSFWCDRVQPGVRKALGRDDLWGVGLSMSAASLETYDQLLQFQLAYDASWPGRDHRLRIDDPDVRRGMVRALDDYTSIWQKGCAPPDSVSATFNNNKAFLDQRVVMTANGTLSIIGALRAKRAEDYYHNVVTIDWPNGANGRPLVIEGFLARAGVFTGGRNPALAEDFVRFLVGEGWLVHWLTFGGDRYATDAEAPRPAVLAGPNRSAPDACGRATP